MIAAELSCCYFSDPSTKLNFISSDLHFFFNFPVLVDNMTEVSSLHDSSGSEPRNRGGRSQPPHLPTVYDHDEAMSTISSVSQQGRRRDDYPQQRGYMENHVRSRSMDNLDDIGRRYPRDDYPPQRRPDSRGGRG